LSRRRSRGRTVAFLVKSIVYLVVSLFFLGLLGCASVIILSWIDIFKDGFKDEPAPAKTNE
jgi:hypothetical protein